MPYTSDCVLQGFRYTDTKKERHADACLSFLEVPPRFELGSQGFADPCLTTWPRHHMNLSRKKGTRGAFLQLTNGAGDEARTRYLHLGKVALYQMSYTRIWCLRSELNQRHADFQSAALPTELYGAGDEARTRYLHLGKVALYRMSYTRIMWCLRSELNQRHADFQSAALPTELQRHVEPS